MVKRLIASFICITFSLSNLQYVHAQDFSINQLPIPGTMVEVSKPFSPLAIKGLVVNPKKPLEFQFIVDTGTKSMSSLNKGALSSPNASVGDIKQQSTQLIKYFLAGLTIPEGELWVNLSPYEKERMVPQALGQTDLGRDLLAQDYILKQLTASLIYPEKALGKEFWSRVYAKAQEQFGTTNIPVNTFNKVWILPNEAQVFQNGPAAYITKSTLKVMLDEDYLSLSKHQSQPGDMFPAKRGTCPQAGCQTSEALNTKAPQVNNLSHNLASQIIRQIILPEIEKEVNTGKNFAPLRQIYQALILAKWYKQTIQNSLLDALYTNKNQVAGVNLNDPAVKEQIYQRYLQAYKKGVFNYIKDDSSMSFSNGIQSMSSPNASVGDQNKSTPRKYFSGGINRLEPAVVATDGSMSSIKSDGAMVVETVAIVAAAGAAVVGSTLWIKSRIDQNKKIKIDTARRLGEVKNREIEEARRLTEREHKSKLDELRKIDPVLFEKLELELSKIDRIDKLETMFPNALNLKREGYDFNIHFIPSEFNPDYIPNFHPGYQGEISLPGGIDVFNESFPERLYIERGEKIDIDKLVQQLEEAKKWNRYEEYNRISNELHSLGNISGDNVFVDRGYLVNGSYDGNSNAPSQVWIEDWQLEKRDQAMIFETFNQLSNTAMVTPDYIPGQANQGKLKGDDGFVYGNFGYGFKELNEPSEVLVTKKTKAEGNVFWELKNDAWVNANVTKEESEGFKRYEEEINNLFSSPERDGLSTEELYARIVNLRKRIFSTEVNQYEKSLQSSSVFRGKNLAESIDSMKQLPWHQRIVASVFADYSENIYETSIGAQATHFDAAKAETWANEYKLPIDDSKDFQTKVINGKPHAYVHIAGSVNGLAADMKVFGEGILDHWAETNPQGKVYFVVKDAPMGSSATLNVINALLNEPEFSRLKQLEDSGKFVILPIHSPMPGIDFGKLEGTELGRLIADHHNVLGMKGEENNFTAEGLNIDHFRFFISRDIETRRHTGIFWDENDHEAPTPVILRVPAGIPTSQRWKKIIYATQFVAARDYLEKKYGAQSQAEYAAVKARMAAEGKSFVELVYPEALRDQVKVDQIARSVIGANEYTGKVVIGKYGNRMLINGGLFDPQQWGLYAIRAAERNVTYDPTRERTLLSHDLILSQADARVSFNGLYFFTPQLRNLVYKEYRARQKRDDEIIDDVNFYLDAYKQGNYENVPLYNKGYFGMTKDGKLVFGRRQLLGGNAEFSIEGFANPVKIDWSQDQVINSPEKLKEAANREDAVLVFTPMVSEDITDQPNKFDNGYFLPVGAGRINLVVVNNKVKVIKDGDVLMPSIGIVISVTKEYYRQLFGSDHLKSPGDVQKAVFNFDWPATEVRPEWYLGGATLLVENGVNLVDNKQDERKYFGEEGWFKLLSMQTQETQLQNWEDAGPRTILGETKSGKIFAYSISGRSNDFKGARFDEAIAEITSILAEKGEEIKNAINLDGGSSVSFNVKDEHGQVYTTGRPATGPDNIEGIARAVSSIVYLTKPTSSRAESSNKAMLTPTQKYYEGEYMYHAVPKAFLDAQRAGGVYTPERFSADGFIHFSADIQTALKMANRFYANSTDEIVLLKVDAKTAGEDNKLVIDDDKDAYPHLYGQLNLNAVSREANLVRNATGQLELAATDIDFGLDAKHEIILQDIESAKRLARILEEKWAFLATAEGQALDSSNGTVYSLRAFDESQEYRDLLKRIPIEYHAEIEAVRKAAEAESIRHFLAARTEEIGRSLARQFSILTYNDATEEELKTKDVDVLMIPGNDDINVYKKVLDLKAKGIGKYILISGGTGRLTLDIKRMADENGFKVEMASEAEMIRSILIQLAQQNKQWEGLLSELKDDKVVILEPKARFTVENFSLAREKFKERGLLPEIGAKPLKVLYIQKPLQQLRTKGNFESVFNKEIADGQIEGISFTTNYFPNENVRSDIVGEFFRIIANGQKKDETNGFLGDWYVRQGYSIIPDKKWNEALELFNSMNNEEKDALVKVLWMNVLNMKLTTESLLLGLPSEPAKLVHAIVDHLKIMEARNAAMQSGALKKLIGDYLAMMKDGKSSDRERDVAQENLNDILQVLKRHIEEIEIQLSPKGEISPARETEIEDVLSQIRSGKLILKGESVDILNLQSDGQINAIRNFSPQDLNEAQQYIDSLKVKGQMDRNIAERLGYFHQTANAFIKTPEGKVLIQVRSPWNTLGLYETIFGGHLDSGKTHLQGVIKELREELSLDRNQKLSGRLNFAGFDVHVGIKEPNGRQNKEVRSLFSYQLGENEWELIQKERIKIAAARADVIKSLSQDTRTIAREFVDYAKEPENSLDFPSRIQAIRSAKENPLKDELVSIMETEKNRFQRSLGTNEQGSGEVWDMKEYSMDQLNDPRRAQVYTPDLLAPIVKDPSLNELKQRITENRMAEIQIPDTDKAMKLNDVGGIDLNQINIKRTGKTIKVEFDPAQLSALEQDGFGGFRPVIIDMRMIKSLLPLLGIGADKGA